jgi:pyruvate dehydrogenase E2 component (dihydrolipoamide acetyltransferase)
MSKQRVTVPDIGGAEDAEVIEVLIEVGDEVAVDQGLIVLESDKASMEIPSTVAGKVVELLVAEGEQLAEGAAIAVIETDGDEAEQDNGQEASPEQAEQAEPEQSAADGDADDGDANDGEEQKSASGDGEPADDRAAEQAGETTDETVTVPDIGTDEAVDLIEVSVAVGDTVAEGDSLVVLESDKASLEVPSPAAGEVAELLVNSGDQVRQGDDLLILRVSRAAAPGGQKKKEQEVEANGKKDAKKGQQKARDRTGEGEESGTSGERRDPTERQQAPATSGNVQSGSDEARGSGRGGIYAGPAVRKLAREFGVPLVEVSGSGPRGRIVKEDLQQYVKQALGGDSAKAAAGAGIPAVPETDFARFGEVEISERSKLDKLTATNMQRSWLNVPHVTQFDEADITALEEFRAGMKAEAEARGTRLTPMPFILKACAVALREHPKFASSLAADGEQLVFKRYFHIGMAVDTPAGLLVPVIRDVDRKSVWELAQEVLDLADKARERKLSPAEMQGGCFTVSSLGNIGGNGFTPIVNAPEVGILGVSRAAIRPVWDGQAFVPRKLLPLALSYDHRVINGGDGGRFLSALVALLGDIRRLVM